MDDWGDESGDESGDEYCDEYGEPAPYAPRLAPQWKFLADWFELVVDRFFIQDPHRVNTHAVRIGREIHDWWINVQYENGALVSKYDDLADNQVLRYRTVCEATLLLGALAQAEYDAFLHILLRKVKFEPPDFMDFQFTTQLPRRFCFFFCEDLQPREYEWSMLQDVFGNESYSEEFQSHLTKICEIVEAEHAHAEGTGVDDTAASVRSRLLAPVTIMLRLKPEQTTIPNQTKILRNITQTILAIQALEQKNRSVADAHRQVPVFHLECIELDLGAFFMHRFVLAAIQKLLETGVRVASLTLPRQHALNDDDAKQYTAWASLVATALGHRKVPQPRRAAPVQVQVDHLVLPQLYAFDLYLHPFLSAMATTTVLKRLRIETGMGTRHEDEAQRRNWAWLAYALFSKASTNSLETLDLNGFQLTQATMLQLARVCAAENPLEELWVSMNPLDDAATSDAAAPAAAPHWSATVSAGATIIPRAFETEMPSVQVKTEWHGTVIRDAAASPLLELLVPGFGLCHVDRSSVSPSPLPSTASGLACKNLQTLVLGCKPFRAPNRRTQQNDPVITLARFVFPLLSRVGSSLTALALEASDLDAVSMVNALSCCPRLESLRLDGVTLGSLGGIIQTYTAGINQRANVPCKISSLDLRDVRMSVEALEEFLDFLTYEDEPMSRTLRRLAFGKGWSSVFRDQTTKLVEEILVHNRFLKYLYVYQGASGGARCDIRAMGSNGEPVEESPLALPSKFAFLSVLRRLEEGGRDDIRSCAAAGALTQDMITQIFDFAAAATWRVAAAVPDMDRIRSST